MSTTKPLHRASFLFALLVLIASPVAAGPILPAGALWEYTFTNPTGTPTWNTTTGVGAGGWTTGLAPFGNVIGPGWDDTGGFFSYNTYWPTDGADGDDLWARTTFDLTGYDPSTVFWNLGVDNGFKLYLNGTLIASDMREGYTCRWEYSGIFGDALLPGVNIIAVALEDHGVATAFDMNVIGDPQPVPEPGATLMLMGMGLAALGGLRGAKGLWRRR